MSEHRRAFDLFGSRVTLLAIPPEGGEKPAALTASLESELREMHRRLTRFDATSELSRVNRDPREVVPVSAVLRRAVGAAVRAAHATLGLADPTLLPEIERAGYTRTLAGCTPVALREALRAAPPRRPARPAPARRWRRVHTSDGALVRAPGVRLDLGGTAKGLAADRCAALLASQHAYAADVGGDLRVGGTGGVPRLVEVEHPFGGAAHRFELTDGAVATSGISRRVWRTPAGIMHHLIDPATGRPAWTGVIQATALAATAVAAEALAKAALLVGPAHGAATLRPGGGVLVLDDGEVVVVPTRPEALAA